MNASDKLRLLIVCAQCDGEDVGESWCSYQWISRLADKCDVTVLTQRFPGHTPPSAQLKNANVVEWEAFPYLSATPRLNSTIKPWYPMFYRRARAWLKREAAGTRHFDLIHQISPMAMRYPSPCAGLGISYVIGPIAGSLPTPAGFKTELDTEPFFTRLRNLDDFRLRHDPWLRRSYRDAALVLCSGPYVAERLQPIGINKIAIESEVGVETLVHHSAKRDRLPGELRMLHAARTVRTKGLRDAIRALAELQDLPNVTLDVAGDGEDLASCKQEANAFNLGDRVRFLGRQPREEIERLYERSDLFLFPSFREPTGIVLFEAMRHSIPIITANVGGPGHIVNDASGIRIDAITPEQFAKDLAGAIRTLAQNPKAVNKLGIGARDRVKEIGLWDNKIERVLSLYREVGSS